MCATVVEPEINYLDAFSFRWFAKSYHRGVPRRHCVQLSAKVFLNINVGEGINVSLGSISSNGQE